MQSLEESIFQSVKSKDLCNLVLDAGEVAMDSLLDDGVARDIPIFGSLVKVCNAYHSVREKIFARKIYKFLSEISLTPAPERAQILEDIANSKGGMNAAGVAVLELVDKLDSDIKPELVGKLFNACGSGYISTADFLRLSDVISKIYISDLLILQDALPTGVATVQQKNIFLSLGLMIFSVKNPARASTTGTSMLQVASDIYDKKFELEYVLTIDAARISKHCFGIDR
ncbi:hypothetical protein [Rheinheimera pacifica]|uniref:hypothetical protein n=1 Tax=Rheinheimera pacifica TaxID=173990 RepID=UPI002EDB4D98